MLPIDQDVREKIKLQDGNIVITASAGTGKTHTTIEKISFEEERNKSFRTFGAITFTKKAAKEIGQRLTNLKSEGFVGTNDNFVLQEIIYPFMYDAYGRDFKKDLKPDYSNANMVNSYKEGIDKIRSTGFIYKYRNRKENFTFQLALEILKKSDAARRYLEAKYYRIYIDEYQDSDKDMHRLFMYICKTIKIPLFIVGDLKQFIYGWRGGYSKGFSDILLESDFSKFRLRHNFRSTVSIQNYSNIFMNDVRCDYQKNVFDKEVCCFAYINNNYARGQIKLWLKKNKACAFLIWKNNDAERWSKELKKDGLDFVFIPGSPLDNSELESEHIWVARLLAFYLMRELYSEYDFYDEIPNSDAYNFYKIKRQLSYIKSSNEEEEFITNCTKLYDLVGYETNSKIKEECKVLYEIVNDEKYFATYNSERFERVVTTVHSAKGLQYEQVIILAENYNLDDEAQLNLHYVATSRPEKRLLILCNYSTQNGKKYCARLKENVEKVKELGIDIELKDVAICINSSEFIQK